MTEEEYNDLICQLKRAAKSDKTYFYWLCPKGEDGEPILYASKKEGPLKRMGKMARKTAQVKNYAHGTVSRDAGGNLLFINNGSVPSQKVTKVLCRGLASTRELRKIKPLLRKSIVNDA